MSVYGFFPVQERIQDADTRAFSDRILSDASVVPDGTDTLYVSVCGYLPRDVVSGKSVSGKNGREK